MKSCDFCAREWASCTGWSIHEQEFRADGETSAVEDWFKAQGHSWDEPKTTIRQRLKNAYVEYRWGLKVYDFPWDFQAGLYHLRNAEPAPKRESEFSHTLYSNTRRGEFHRNKDRHRERSELEVKRKEAQLQCEEDLLLQRQADLTEKLKELQDRKAKVINPLNSS
ncbi:hypothetical protein TCAL_16793 [Tigriopus californicus]|uniref:Uncharacterized protein n=1 Tax=Tigriopus californicus TaxID=6832 RepID=A0A553PTA9_TIGCA|nr:hypothetical protein TCAL_16793 [Tigriopus californicus]